MNPIVTVNVSQQQAPTPNALQKQGAFVSVGGTTIAAGNYEFLSEFSDLEQYLSAGVAITSLSWSSAYGGLVTVTTAAAHGIPTNTQFVTTIEGVTPDGYKGTVLATATGASTFTYYLVTNPGVMTVAGTYTPSNTAELTAMARTFFSQGGTQGAYVLELGAVSIAAAVAALQTFIDDSPQFFYGYLVPRAWDGNSTFLTFLNNFEATTSKTYFWVTTNLQNRALYDDTMKDVLALVEAPVYRPWAANTYSAASWSGGSVTASTANAHGIHPGDTFVISGASPAGYNGTFIALPGTTGSTLICAVATNPGAYVSGAALLIRRYASAGVPADEFDWAAGFYRALNFNPSSLNRVPPYAFGNLTDVTRFPTQGNSALLVSLEGSDTSYVSFGGEGGITNDMLFKGHTKDGRPFNYWYSADFMQVAVKQDLANAIINGSNTTINPLYYNQQGIDRLQQVASATGGRAITYGHALGRVIITQDDPDVFTQRLNDGEFAGNLVVNAIPFTTYATQNPSHYKDGIYNGLTMVYTPLVGFEHILFNIQLTDFVGAR